MSVGGVYKASALCSRLQHVCVKELPPEVPLLKDLIIVDHCTDVDMVKDRAIMQNMIGL